MFFRVVKIRHVLMNECTAAPFSAFLVEVMRANLDRYSKIADILKQGCISLTRNFGKIQHFDNSDLFAKTAIGEKKAKCN